MSIINNTAIYDKFKGKKKKKKRGDARNMHYKLSSQLEIYSDNPPCTTFISMNWKPVILQAFFLVGKESLTEHLSWKLLSNIFLLELLCSFPSIKTLMALQTFCSPEKERSSRDVRWSTRKMSSLCADI